MRLGTVPCPRCGLTGSLWVEQQWIDEIGDLHLGVMVNCGCGTVTNTDAVVKMKAPKPLLAEPQAQQLPASEPYDPGAHTVAEVKAHVTEHPDEAEAILAAEYAGQARITLIEWLEAQLEAP